MLYKVIYISCTYLETFQDISFFGLKTKDETIIFLKIFKTYVGFLLYLALNLF